MIPPFERSYWVIPDKFLAGYYPGDVDTDRMSFKLAGLFNVGISTVINLMEPDELDFHGNLFKPYEAYLTSLARARNVLVECLRFPIEDLSIPAPEQMVQILDTIDHNLSLNKSVYVHCLGGIGRTGTVVGCYLIRHKMAASENVLETINELRRKDNAMFGRSPQTFEQESFVIHWGKRGFL